MAAGGVTEEGHILDALFDHHRERIRAAVGHFLGGGGEERAVAQVGEEQRGELPERLRGRGGAVEVGKRPLLGARDPDAGRIGAEDGRLRDVGRGLDGPARGQARKAAALGNGPEFAVQGVDVEVVGGEAGREPDGHPENARRDRQCRVHRTRP